MTERAENRQDHPLPHLTRRGHFRTVGLAFAGALLGPLLAACGPTEEESAPRGPGPVGPHQQRTEYARQDRLPPDHRRDAAAHRPRQRVFQAEGLTVSSRRLFRGWNALAEAFFSPAVSTWRTSSCR